MGRGGGSAQRHAELLANRCTNGIYVTIHISSQSRDFPAGLGRLRAGRMGVTSSSAGTRKRYGLPTTASDLRASSSRSRSGLGRSWTGPGPRRRPVILLGGFVGDGMAAWRRQVEALSNSYTVVVWDTPGSGESSDVPESFDCPTTRTALPTWCPP
jgi:hypothetical protein